MSQAELQVAGEQVGLVSSDVFWVIQRLVPAFAVRRAGFLEDRHWPPMFALRDLAKDLDLAMALFVRSSVDAPMTTRARSLVSDAARRTGDLDITSVIQNYRHPGRAVPVERAPRSAKQEVARHA